MGLEKDFHQQAIHRRFIQRDLLVAFFLAHRFPRQFQPIQRALARQGLALVALPRPARSRQSGGTTGFIRKKEPDAGEPQEVVVDRLQLVRERVNAGNGEREVGIVFVS